jgi:hypothetical protein
VAEEVIESGACPLLAQSGHWQANFAVLHNNPDDVVG